MKAILRDDERNRKDILNSIKMSKLIVGKEYEVLNSDGLQEYIVDVNGFKVYLDSLRFDLIPDLPTPKIKGYDGLNIPEWGINEEVLWEEDTVTKDFFHNCTNYATLPRTIIEKLGKPVYEEEEITLEDLAKKAFPKWETINEVNPLAWNNLLDGFVEGYKTALNLPTPPTDKRDELGK